MSAADSIHRRLIPRNSLASLPAVLTRLLGVSDKEARDRAWAEFVGEYSRLIHLTARKAHADYDELMDRYAFVLDELQRDDFRRLRVFQADGRSKFTTWLVLVSSRLCVDYQRKRYGRFTSAQSDDRVEARRRLVDLVGDDVNLDSFADDEHRTPEAAVRESQLRAALEASISGLGSVDRLLLRLKYEDGRPASEIARLIGLSSEFAVYRRLKHVLRRLRQDLNAQGVDDSSA